MITKLSSNLKKLRTQQALTQKYVAEKIGVATSTYSLYESGNREPNLQTVIELAKVFSVSCDELIGNETMVVDKIADTDTLFAAHFKGESFTQSEIMEIVEFMKFVKSRAKG